MSGPQGPDQQWQPPGQGGDRSSEPTQVGSPWQQQPDPGGDVAGPGVHAARRVPAVPTAG